MTLLDHALAYAKHGWAVHPLKPRDKKPLTQHGCKDATTNLALIEKWWKQNPKANIGLATGLEFFVIDIDPAKGGGIWLESNDLPSTHESATGSGGKHLLYSIPAGVTIQNSVSLIAPGVDIRGVGGYIVAPPSIHPNGVSYNWLDCDGLVPDGRCADAPLWLIDVIVKVAPTSPASSKKFDLPEKITKGVQHITLFRYACSLRSKTLMTEDEIFNLVWDASQRCEEIPPPANVRKIVESACKYPAGLSPEYQERAFEKFARSLGDTAVEEQPPEDKPKTTPPNKLAEKILEHHSIINVDQYIYEYETSHWRLISPERLKALGMNFDTRTATTQKRRNEIASYIQHATHRKRQNWRILEPWEIPVANGVIDIRNMAIRPHRQNDMLRACIPIEYDPHAQAPVLMKTLDTYFGGDDDGENKTSAIQEFFGYCLMPHALYKKALCCFGESNCGKSTIPFLIRELIGIENISSVPLEDMDDSRKIAPMMGKMVNLLGDLPQNGVIGEGGFKKLVSVGETLQFDPKYLPPVEEISTCKVLFCANPPLPKISDQSKAMYERLLLVQFLYEIPRLEQDRGIQAKLSTERDGLLLWALEGAQRLFLADGQFTTVGQRELKAYREEQNPINDFITDECEIEPDINTPVTDIHAKFSKWYGRPVTPQYLCQLLRGAGYEITRNPIRIGTRRTRAVIGLRLP